MRHTQIYYHLWGKFTILISIFLCFTTLHPNKRKEAMENFSKLIRVITPSIYSGKDLTAQIHQSGMIKICWKVDAESVEHIYWDGHCSIRAIKAAPSVAVLWKSWKTVKRFPRVTLLLQLKNTSLTCRLAPRKFKSRKNLAASPRTSKTLKKVGQKQPAQDLSDIPCPYFANLPNKNGSAYLHKSVSQG